jgi:hypothetical protein
MRISFWPPSLVGPRWAFKKQRNWFSREVIGGSCSSASPQPLEDAAPHAPAPAEPEKQPRPDQSEDLSP